MNKKWLTKSIEVYDGNWSSHYICPLGNIICIVAIVAFFSSLISAAFKPEITLVGLIITGVLFTIGSLIGYTGAENDK